MKDLFSKHASTYAAFRPVYPKVLYDFIFEKIQHKRNAWDAGTGNGQVAQYLAEHFDHVHATDISAEQLKHAASRRNVSYHQSPAEHTDFANDTFDLITVAQALHWIDTPAFFNEASRVGRPESLVAVWGYSLLKTDTRIDQIIENFYTREVGKYWDPERRLIDTHYRDVKFPFTEIQSPDFYIDVEWTREHLEGYILSWSATQKYIQTNHFNPVNALSRQLDSYWRCGESKSVRFPIFMRVGVIRK